MNKDSMKWISLNLRFVRQLTGEYTHSENGREEEIVARPYLLLHDTRLRSHLEAFLLAGRHLACRSCRNKNIQLRLATSKKDKHHVKSTEALKSTSLSILLFQ